MSSLLKKLIRYSKTPRVAGVRLYCRMTEVSARLRYRTARRQSELRTYPVIWIRTPKCASSSIVVALEAVDALLNWNANPELRVTDEVVRQKVICVGADNKERFIDLYPVIWETAFRWAVVRNPFDRAISAWRYLEILRSRALWEVLANPPQRQERPAEYHHFTRTFHDMLSINGKLVVHKVVRYENLGADLGDLFNHIGLQYLGLPHANITPNKTHYLDYLDARSLSMIRDLYAADFDVFDYPKHVRL